MKDPNKPADWQKSFERSSVNYLIGYLAGKGTSNIFGKFGNTSKSASEAFENATQKIETLSKKTMTESNIKRLNEAKEVRKWVTLWGFAGDSSNKVSSQVGEKIYEYYDDKINRKK